MLTVSQEPEDPFSPFKNCAGLSLFSPFGCGGKMLRPIAFRPILQNPIGLSDRGEKFLRRTLLDADELLL